MTLNYEFVLIGDVIGDVIKGISACQFVLIYLSWFMVLLSYNYRTRRRLIIGCFLASSESSIFILKCFEETKIWPY